MRLFGEQYARQIEVAVADVSRISETELALSEFIETKPSVQVRQLGVIFEPPYLHAIRGGEIQ